MCLMDEATNLKERVKIENNFDPEDPVAGLKYFVYLNTGEYAYKKVNNDPKQIFAVVQR